MFSEDKTHKINLIDIGKKHVFKLNDTDYWTLRDTNTFFANEVIRITYTINGREYTRNYYEIFGDVF